MKILFIGTVEFSCRALATLLENNYNVVGLITKRVSNYNTNFHEHPFPRSNKNIEALATFRGATAGVKYAEAFQVLKIIDK